jgi:hypothetical protein
MKTGRIRAVTFDNRKRVLRVTYSMGKTAVVPFGMLGIQQKLADAWVDKETRGMAVGLRLEGGEEEFMPYDQPLALTRDPEFLLRTHIERLVAQIERALSAKRVSKRYLANQLGTSDNQIQRLLDPKILNKNLEQLYRIATLLGLELEWRVKNAA